MQKNLKTQKKLSPFASDAVSFFHGDLLPGKWTYSSPDFKGDKVNGAFLFTLFTRTPDYYLRRNEEALIAKQAATIINKADPFDIFADMGCGDAFATKIEPFLKLTNADYAAIDINDEFIEKAFRHCQVLFPEKTAYKKQADFMKDDITFPAVAFPAMLGSTITNFGTTESVRIILRQARKIAEAGNGHFIFSHDSNQEPESLKKTYGPMEEHTVNVMYRMERDLNMSGFDPSAFRSDQYWDADKNISVIYISPTKDMTFSIEGEEISLKKDQILPQAHMMKLSAEHMIDLAKIIGFNDITSYYDDDKNIVLHQASL